ncbi:hypothetical protein OG909_30510 [Streptomyces sp. NBC_01754]|uniref:hypothetical protein n=1 Tax=Streptomyces sp. NBC_01754 TaxID=2975930 RepID=UPI002DDAB9BB|nr:hypothetical protein [Streptomyces sp. NBC_01754]WSC96286.1 hypothetical protein OG909_30510 [Streptomyces sp. NBC_01754]
MTIIAQEGDSSALVSLGQDHMSDSVTFTSEAKGKGTTRFTLMHCTFTTCQGST